MNRILSMRFLLGLMFAFVPLLVEAHHSAVMFDTAKEITVEGTVKEFQYTNPHSWLLVDVTNKDGSVTTWGFEAEGPSTLMQRKIRPSDFPFGTKLTITGNPMNGGQQPPSFAQLPDWSGLWTASGGGSFVDRGPTGVSPKLTTAAAAAVRKGEELESKGISYDENLSECGPPGFPRWLVIPFLREFIVRPEQTWLSSETVNNVRRIYTDGRGHPPVEDRYPLYYGDSIGFWDRQKLVIHTNQLMRRSMGRNQPEQSEQMETVEIWEEINPRTIEAKVWIY